MFSLFKSLILPLSRTAAGRAVTGSDSARDVPAGEAWYEYVDIHDVRDGKIWFRLSKNLYFSCTIKGITYRVCVPEGFITDLASTPQALWSIYPPFGNYTKAAILHDFMTGARVYPFKVCDRIFLQAMIDLPPRTSWRTRNIFYLAVRVFGAAVYAGHTVESVVKDRSGAFSCNSENWSCPFGSLGCDMPSIKVRGTTNKNG